jgi:poly-gamma-glutamate synthesis protein (capsule biosynthesis protein)
MKVAFVGDLVLQNIKEKPSFIFTKLKDIIDKEKSHLIVNLESPFIRKENYPIKNKITLYALKDGLSYLSYLNPYLINLSNNHINDYGNESVEYTMNLLDEHSISCFGVGLENQNFNSYTDEKEKIIFLAYATRSSDFTGSKLFAEENFYGVKDVDLKEIETVRKEYPSYAIIVNIHWGIEDIKYPEPEKVMLGRQIIDAGADLVIGHHPHIIQPYAKYKEKYIFYSIGNFYFNNIHFELNGRTYLKNALKHQKKGLMPMFSIKNGNVRVEKIFMLTIKKDNHLTATNIKIKELYLLKVSQKFYLVYYHLYSVYLFFIFNMKRIYRVICNPKLILNKFRQR